jgi:hypothetical protein
LSVTEWSLKDDVKLSEFSVLWERIASYKIDLSASNTTNLSFYMKDGSSRTYAFQDKKTEEEAISQESIVGVLRSFINQYNAEQPPERQIVLKPGFLVTPFGTFLLWGVVLLAVCATIVCCYTRSKKSLGLLVMSISMLMGVWGKKSNDQAFYKKLSCMDGTRYC